MSKSWTKNSKYDIPENFGWEFHNPDASRQAREREALGETGAIDNYRHEYIESAGQRETRWRRLWIQKEMFERSIKNFQEFKDNPKEYMRKLDRAGKFLSKWWYTVPKKTFGQGKLHQKLDGSWQQEYRPSKSMNMKKWLEASNHGQVFTATINKERVPVADRPNPDQIEISNQAKTEYQRQWWDEMFRVTNNFGKGSDKPKQMPGTGGNNHRILK